jgi:hypothetical protein
VNSSRIESLVIRTVFLGYAVRLRTVVRLVVLGLRRTGTGTYRYVYVVAAVMSRVSSRRTQSD